jgi:hypothetical protein
MIYLIGLGAAILGFIADRRLGASVFGPGAPIGGAPMRR